MATAIYATKRVRVAKNLRTKVQGAGPIQHHPSMIDEASDKVSLQAIHHIIGMLVQMVISEDDGVSSPDTHHVLGGDA